MRTEPDQATLDTSVCEQARLTRDARFDGLFFTAVKTTGIYCRPVCPAPTPKPSNISYYASAAAAAAALA
jgi:AraC family transcriptional regulator of adaptative response / DNA-3-methyladenine glycosylase II